MLFRRKPKKPLAEAERLVNEAIVLIRHYWRDRNHTPDQADMGMLLRLENILFRHYSATRRISIRMERRFHGEPEINERKWLR
jgi:hypothetical protein